MEFEQKKRNTPIATLIRNYSDKKSGKVAVSRRELQWRYASLDWKDQKKILRAFLISCRSERIWACKKLLYYWDRSLEPLVLDMWESQHHEELAWLIIRWFPITYLKEHLEELSEGRNYYFLALRLSDDKDFVLDESRLKEADLLHILVVLKKPVSNEMGRDILFGLVERVCEWQASYLNGKYWEGYIDFVDKRIVGILDLTVVRSILKDLLYLKKDHIVNEFVEWNYQVIQQCYNSEEFKMLKEVEKTRYVDENTRIDIMKKYCYENLCPQYRKGPLSINIPADINYLVKRSQMHGFSEEDNGTRPVDEMRAKNPAIDCLIEEFELSLLEELPC